MALKITLKPSEKFVINGAVVINGDRRTSLIIQNKVSILREKDILQAEDANTPARRIYFAIMLMYLNNDENDRRYYDDFVVRMTEFMDAIETPEALQKGHVISREVMGGQYYRALMNCKQLYDFEAERLAYVS